MLFDALVAVQNGDMSSTEAVKMASVVRQIVATCDLELRARKQASELDPDNADAMVLAPPVVMLTGKTESGNS